MNLWGFIKGILIRGETDKTIEFSIEAGGDSGTRTTLQSTQTADQTLNLPDTSTTDTLVSEAFAQTVTNKNLADSTNTITNASADSFTRETGNQSQVNIPDTASADTIALENFSQTFTNKNIDGTTAGTNTVTNRAQDVEVDPSGKNYITGTEAATAFTELDTQINTNATNISNNASAISTKAENDLSDLVATSINQDLVADGNGTRDLGSAVNKWQEGHINKIYNDFFQLTRETGQPVNLTTVDPDVGLVIETAEEPNADASNSGQVTIQTGNKTAGTGDSGDLFLKVGTSSGGNRGNIILQDGSEGTVGHVWTSINAFGGGEWQPFTGGANSTLSNLTSPTSVNQSLIADNGVANSRNIGSNTNPWRIGYFQFLSVFNAGLNAFSFEAAQASTNNQPSNQANISIARNNALLPMSFANSRTGQDLYLETANAVTTTATGNISILTGNQTGTADSGDILIKTGTINTGTRGEIQLQNSTEGTIGHVWTSTGVNGEGSWAAAGGFTPVKVAAYLSSSATVNTTETQIVYDTETTDTDGAYNNGTGTFTVPVGKSGNYSIKVTGFYGPASANGNRYLEVKLNGTSEVRAYAGSDTNNGSSAVISIDMDLSAGDILTFFARTFSGVSETLTGGSAPKFSYMSITQLS